MVLDHLRSLSEGVSVTLLLTASAFLIGAVIAVPVAAARQARARPIRLAAIIYIEVLRGVPPIAWLFLLFYGLAQVDVRLDSLPAAILGLGAISGAYLAEVYRAGLRALPAGQWEAARAVGLRELQVYRLVVAPQAIPTIVPPAAAFAVGLLKDSAIASVIGVVEITAIAFNLTRREVDGLAILSAAGLLYLALSVPLGALSRELDRRLTRQLAPR